MDYYISHSQSNLFTTLDAALQLSGLEVSAPEVHGVVTGLVCNGTGAFDSNDAMALLANPSQYGSQPRLLDLVRDMIGSVHHSLHEAGHEFELLLPGEDADIASQTEAIADWCQGFVLGLLQGGHSSLENFPGDAKEAVEDILAIAQAESGGEDIETEQRALVELEEYLRVSVQLIFEELNPVPPGSGRTLH